MLLAPNPDHQVSTLHCHIPGPSTCKDAVSFQTDPAYPSYTILARQLIIVMTSGASMRAMHAVVFEEVSGRLCSADIVDVH